MGPFVFLDIETTGVNPSKDHIIEIACLLWQNGEITKKFETLINPHVPIPYEITLLTGITDDDTKKAPSFSEVKQKIIDFIGDCPIVGHNIQFDTGFFKSHHFDIKNPEIDTLVLAKILLRKEASYALEVLMKKYKLPLYNSHRAMADTQAAVDFFEFLVGKIAELPENALKIAESVLKKSNWVGKEVFMTRERSKYEEREKQVSSIKYKSIEKKIMHENFWNDEVSKAFLGGGKILLESASYVPFSALKKEKLLIAYSSVRKRNDMAEAAKKQKLSVALLKESHFYLSPKRLEQKLSAKSFTAEETPFLLKMILWKFGTETGDREEIALEREEYEYFDCVADIEGNDTFWQKALNEAKNSADVLIHQSGLAHGLAKRLTTNRKLIIVEACKLEDSLTNAMRRKFTEARLHPAFGAKATVVFGLLGIFYEHFVEKDFGGFMGNVILDESMRSSPHWKRFTDAIANLPENTKKEEFLAALSPEENTVSWVNLFADEISFSTAPIFIANLFQNAIAPFSSVILQSKALSGDKTFNLVRDLFELDSNWSEIREEKPIFGDLNIKIPEDFPEPNSEGYFKKCLALFSEIIEGKTGKSLFILYSKKAVEAFYKALLPIAQKEGIKILGVGTSGGIGKSLALFLENPDQCVLLSTNQIIPFLEEIEDDIKTIVFQKIPFDSPADPLCSARSKQFENGFKEYTLPRAVMKFRELLAELGRGKSKTCHLLDSRLNNREYGNLFI